MGKVSVLIVQLFAVCLVLICASATGATYAFSARVERSISNLRPHEIIAFRDVLTNSGGAYNKLTGVYTCPVSGMYQFMVTILSGANRVIETQLIAKDQVKMYIYSGAGSGRHGSGSNTVLLYLNVGDKVYVRASSGGYIHWRWSTFSGFLI